MIAIGVLKHKEDFIKFDENNRSLKK